MIKHLLIGAVTMAFISHNTVKAEAITITAAVAAVVATGAAVKSYIDAKKHCRTLCNRHTCGVGVQHMPQVESLRGLLQRHYPEKHFPLLTLGSFCKKTCQEETEYKIQVSEKKVVTDEKNPNAKDVIEKSQINIPITVKKRYGPNWTIRQCVIAHNKYMESKGLPVHKKPSSISAYSEEEFGKIYKMIDDNDIAKIHNYFRENLKEQ